MSQKPYNYNAQARRTPAQRSEARKVRRGAQSTSAPQSKDEAAAQKAAKKANAEKVERQMQERRAAQQQAQTAQGNATRMPTGQVPRSAATQGQPAANATPHAAQAQSTQQKETPAKASAKKKAAKPKTAAKSNAKTSAKPKKPSTKAKNKPKPSTKAKKNTKAVRAEAPLPKKNITPQNPNHAPLYNIDADARQAAPVHAPKKGQQPKPMTQAAQRRRRTIRNLLAGLLVMVLVVVGVVYSVNLLFRVKNIEIQTPEGETPADTGIYTEAIILERLGISIDDHFFSFSAADAVATLSASLPLLENIEVLRDYPDTVIVRVSPAVETYTIQIADGWLVLSAEFHVMDTVSAKPNLLQIVGATPSTYVAGQELSFVQTLEESWYAQYEDKDATALQALVNAESQARSDAQIETLTTIIEALEEAELLADVTGIEFEGEEGIAFLYQDRIVVLIGTTNSLDYKLSIVQYILWNENGDGCDATDTGVLDVSYQSADGTITTTFAQGDFTFPVESTTATDTDDTLEEDTDAEGEVDGTEGEADTDVSTGTEDDPGSEPDESNSESAA